MECTLFVNLKKQQMRTLTINELCGYLPYDLEIQTPDGVSTMVSIIGADPFFEVKEYTKEDSTLIRCAANNFCHYSTWGISQVKPHLRPLSKLTEEKWKRKLMSFLSDGRSDAYPDSEIRIATKKRFATFKIEMHTYRGLNSSELFSFTVYKNAEPSMTKYNLMQWYFENHFDVHGLIDAGLAIPITDK